VNLKGRCPLPPASVIQLLVRWTRPLLFISGVAALAYVGLVLLDAKLFQASQSQRFQQELQTLKTSPVSDTLLPQLLAEPGPVRVGGPSGDNGDRHALGRIEISAIGLSAMILEGADERTLRQAVGHIPGTPLPGQPGNVALAGHRDTFFRALRRIRENDEITVETLSGSYRYRVDFTKVVDPGEVQVLDNADTAILTLVTCYPFSFVGPAPKRFVVRAHKLAATAPEPASAEVMSRKMYGTTTAPQTMR
jgi:sortase A